MRLTKDEYSTDAFNKVEKYLDMVENNRIQVPLTIKQLVSKYRSELSNPKFEYRKERVARVFRFLSLINIKQKAKEGKKFIQFNIQPWQAFVVSFLYGLYIKDTEYRKYRYLILTTSRKSGKTVFNVVLLMYMMFGENEQNPDCYLLANTREQAGTALRYMKDIVKNSPAILPYVKVQQYQILYPKRNGIMKTLAADAEKLDSLNVYGCIIDEFHAMSDTSLFDVMKSGAGERENPLIIITSTAGFRKDYPFYQMVMNSKKILKGELEDESMLPVLYELDEEDDISDISKWIKANPNLGVTVSLHYMLTEYNQTKAFPTQLRNFIVKNLNRYADNEETWIPDEVYKEVFIEPSEEILTDSSTTCYAGFDLSSTRDLSAFVLVFYNSFYQRFYVKPYLFFPKGATNKIRPDGIDFTQFIKNGYMYEMDGGTINFNEMFEIFAEAHAKYNIKGISYDTFNSTYLINRIKSELAIECNIFQQNTQTFNFPLKFMEKLIYDKTIEMSENPALRWNFMNAVLYTDGNGNIKIMKNTSRDSVDGAVALGMAIGSYLHYEYDEDRAILEGWLK
jgi:phage terminase large subunit-like protein